MRLLLVEDNPRLSANIRAALARAGFVVDVVASGSDAVHSARSVVYDAVVLDLGLPDRDGLSVLADIRARDASLPVLICTARDAFEDRISGLDAGADDYLVKPFNMGELIARVRALLRRPGGALGLELSAANLSFDTKSRETRVDGTRIKLTSRETALLETLLRRIGRVVPKDALEQSLYGFDHETTPNAVEVATHRLRKKLEKSGARARIHTLRGLGYLLEDGAP